MVEGIPGALTRARQHEVAHHCGGTEPHFFLTDKV